MGSRVSSRESVGREDALALVEHVLDCAARGRPRVCLIAGEAGIGKTRLVSELEHRAREAGFLVLHGESVEFGGDDLPYAPVVAALRDLPEPWLPEALDGLPVEVRGELGALLPRTVPAPSGERFTGRFGQGRLYELLLGLLGRLAADRAPVLLVLEDLHWADRSSRDLLAFLARNLRGQRLALAATYRTDELQGEHPLRRLVPELTRRPTVLRIELEPLSAGEVGRQVEAITGHAVAVTLAERLHARAGGNPFLVEELLAAGGAEVDAVPNSLADAVLVRVGTLDPSARQVLAAVAAAGGRIDHGVLDRVAGDVDVPAALRAALDVHLLVRDREDRGVAFRHGLIGEVLYGGLLPQERSRMHRKLAVALADTPDASMAQLAEHWHRAGEYDEALRTSIASGLEASRLYAFSEALGHFQRALELWDRVSPPEGSLPASRVTLLERAAQAARFAGEARTAIALCEEALARLDHQADAVHAALLFERLGDYHFWDDAKALECYRRALQLLPDGAEPERARLRAAEGHALMGMRRWEESRACCEDALRRATEAGVPEVQLHARSTLALVLVFLGEPDAGEEHFRQALDAAGAPGAGEVAVRAHLQLGELRRLRGDYAGALDVMVRGEQAAARLGMRSSFGNFMYANGADDLLRLGRWDEVAARLEEQRQRGLGSTTAVLHHTVAGHLHALRGESDAARAELSHADELLREGLPSEFGTPLQAAWAVLYLSDGDAEEAARHVAEALESLGDTKEPLYTPALYALGVRAEAERAERARALRREADLEAALERARELAADLDRLLATWRGEATPGAMANAALVHAELGRAEGAGDPRRWETAIQAWEALADPHTAAYARLRRAEALLLAGGDRADAGRELSAAHSAAARLGAAPLLAEAERLARRSRISLEASPAPVGTHRDGPAAQLGLTSREVEVLCLLAEGLTNRQIAARLFISQKTVASHLAHVFDKLAVHSRVEAAGRAHQLGLVEGRS